MADKASTHIAVTGKGKLVGPFFTAGMKAFPKATFYDHTDQLKKAIDSELALAEEIPTDEKYVEKLKEAKKRKPEPTAITVTFKESGDIQEVTVSGPKGKKTLKLDVSAEAIKSSKDFDACLDAVVKEVKRHI